MSMGLINNIRKKRNEKGWTQAELAAKLGPTVTRNNISRWENGHTFPSLDMVLRNSQHPVFIIQDEPHQYMKSGRTWRSAAVESRKWRFSYVWMFHAFEQLPRDVAAIIQAAGPHYHLYSSSKATYRALAEEIAPFEVEEAMGTPRHWAINVVRASGMTVKPFLAKMAVPPSMRKEEFI